MAHVNVALLDRSRTSEEVQFPSNNMFLNYGIVTDVTSQVFNKPLPNAYDYVNINILYQHLMNFIKMQKINRILCS
jgi:hypothetical protein